MVHNIYRIKDIFIKEKKKEKEMNLIKMDNFYIKVNFSKEIDMVKVVYNIMKMDK